MRAFKRLLLLSIVFLFPILTGLRASNLTDHPLPTNTISLPTSSLTKDQHADTWKTFFMFWKRPSPAPILAGSHFITPDGQVIFVCRMNIPNYTAYLHVGKQVYTLGKGQTHDEALGYLYNISLPPIPSCTPYYFTYKLQNDSTVWRYPPRNSYLTIYSSARICTMPSNSILVFAIAFSDLTIALSYYAIPLLLYYIQMLMPTLPFRWVLWLFQMFITSCGTTHLLTVWFPWTKNFTAVAISKVVTAVVSAITAILLVKLFPRAISFPAKTARLEKEIGYRIRQEQTLLAIHDQSTKFRRITQSIRHSLDPATIFRMTANDVCRVMIMDACVLFMDDLGSTTVSCCAECQGSSSLPTTWSSLKIPKLHPIIQLILANNAPEVLTMDDLLSIVDSLGKTGLAMPFSTADGRHGFILLLSYQQGFSWSAQAKELLEDIAEQVSIALNHASLVEREKMRSEQLEFQLQENAALGKAKDDAELSNKLKSEFLATMSHEIRTPMNAVIGLVDVLLDSKVTHEQREILEIIKTSSHTLLSVLNDILDFTKYESTGFQLENVTFNLRTCIESSVELMFTDAIAKGLRLNYSIAVNTPEFLAGDSIRLRQILVNLMSNALKFTENGEVMVKAYTKPGIGVTPMITTDESNPENPGTFVFPQGALNTLPEAIPDDENLFTVYFDVVDTGIGIPYTKMSKLFQKFTQLESGITRRFGGTGLGLSICAKLVSLMHGQIWVTSQIGKGSVFSFYVRLPMPTNAQLSLPPAFSNFAFSKLNVALIDKYEPDRLALYDLLRQIGAQCELFASCREAENVQEPLDVMIISIETVREMESQESFNILMTKIEPSHVLLLTRFRNEPKIAQLDTNRNYRYLAKPVKRDTLMKSLMQAQNAFTEPVAQRIVKPRLVLSDLNVLIVDDNKVNLRVASKLLSKLGIAKLSTALNGRDAISEVERQNFDVILMDISMPEMDGLSATELIHKQLMPMERPWVVAMTASVLHEDRKRCFAAGMNDFLAKPIRTEDLLTLFDKYLANTEALDAAKKSIAEKG